MSDIKGALDEVLTEGKRKVDLHDRELSALASGPTSI
jgi:hypothetical protein